MEIPQTIMSRFGNKQIKNEEISISRIRAAFGTETIPLSNIIVYHRGIDEEKRVVATALKIHAKEADCSFGGIIRVEILGGYAWNKRGTSYFVTERCNQLRKMLTTNTSTFKKCTFVPIGDALFRLGEIEHLCDVPGLEPSALVETSTVKAYLKRKKYDEMKSPPTKMGRHTDHVKRTLRGIVTQYYKHGKSTFKEESQADIQSCLREIFAEYDVNAFNNAAANTMTGKFSGFTPGAMYADPGYYTPAPAMAPAMPSALAPAGTMTYITSDHIIPPPASLSSASWMLPLPPAQKGIPLPPCAVPSRPVRVVTPDNQESWPHKTHETWAIPLPVAVDVENAGKLALPYIGDMTGFM